ncbi:hypothetical protein I4O98_018015 [Clostridioides difficile]
MVLGVGAMMTIVDAAGGIDLMSNALSSLMNSKTATPIMSISAGLMSMVSSALAVVYPTMMPMCVDIAKAVGGVDPLALILCSWCWRFSCWCKPTFYWWD